MKWDAAPALSTGFRLPGPSPSRCTTSTAGRARFLPPTTMSSPIWREPKSGSRTIISLSKNGVAKLFFCAISSKARRATVTAFTWRAWRECLRTSSNAPRKSWLAWKAPATVIKTLEPGNRSASTAPAQMGLFNSTDDRLGDRLRDLNLSTMTPLEAMNVLHQLIEEVKK